MWILDNHIHIYKNLFCGRNVLKTVHSKSGMWKVWKVQDKSFLITNIEANTALFLHVQCSPFDVPETLKTK